MLKLSIPLSRRLPFKGRYTLPLVGLTVIVGIVAVIFVFAAGPFAVFEPESATLSNGATQVSRAGASGGKTIKFGASATPTPTPTPAPTPTPTPGSGSCALPKYPTPACTGVPAGTVITNTVNGNYTVTTSGQVIDGWHITGTLLVNASNVTIKNSQIDDHVTGEGSSTSSFTIMDSTVGPASGCIFGEGIMSSRYTVLRVHIRGIDDGFQANGSNVTIRDSYVKLCSLSGSHSDGIQENGGGAGITNLIMDHNTIDQRFAPSHSAPINLVEAGTKNVTLTNNLLMGGTYTIFLDPIANPWGVVQNNRVVNNTWDYDPNSNASKCSHITSWTGNTLVTIDSNYTITSTVASMPCIE